VKAGDEVKAGEELAVVEAMKMENSLRATADVTIGEGARRRGPEPRGRPAHPRLRVR
jgi:propionyl-CoA carboxylase alpha chain